MVKKRKPYKTYAREFKIEAVRLMRESGRPTCATSTGRCNTLVKSVS